MMLRAIAYDWQIYAVCNVTIGKVSVGYQAHREIPANSGDVWISSQPILIKELLHDC